MPSIQLVLRGEGLRSGTITSHVVCAEAGPFPRQREREVLVGGPECPHNVRLQVVRFGYADLVFKDAVLEDGVVPLCAAKAAQEQGDAREALDLMETAGNISRKENAEKVSENHVERASDRVEEQRVLTIVRDQLTSQMKLALLATTFLNIDEPSEPRAKNIYQVYKNICKTCGYEPRSKRRLNDFLGSIRLYGLLERDERNLGRAGGRSYIHTLEVEPALVFEGLEYDSEGEDSVLNRSGIIPNTEDSDQYSLESFGV